MTIPKSLLSRAKTTMRPSIRWTTKLSADPVAVELPIRAVNLTNDHTHWRQRHRRSQEHRAATAYALAGHYLPTLPVTVTLTRVGVRKLDSDSVACSMKHVRDDIADGYGVDDEDPRVEWEYAQTTGVDYAVHVVISPSRKRRKGDA